MKMPEFYDLRPFALLGLRSLLTVHLSLFSFQLLAAQPQRPQGVDFQARYHNKSSVWILDQVGKRTVWFKKGILKALGNYEGNRRVGTWIFYHPNGKKKAQGKYKEGKRKAFGSFSAGLRP